MKVLISFFFNLILIVLSVIVLFISYVSAVTLNGDNDTYYNGWSVLGTGSFIQDFKLHSIQIDAVDPVYFFSAYLFHHFTNYPIFILFLNAIFLIVLYFFFKKYFVNHIFIYFFTLITNVYVYVVLFETHRFKLALLFFMMSMIASIKFSKLFKVLSVFSHLQILILFLSFILSDFIKRLLKFKLSKNFLLIIGAIFILLILFSSQVISKWNYYFIKSSFPFSTIVFVLIYYFYLIIFNVRINPVFLSLTVIVLALSFFISGDRINLFLISYAITIEFDNFLRSKYRALFILLPFTIYHLLKIMDFIKELDFDAFIEII